MMSLGMFVFQISTAAYDDLQRRTGWRFGETPRVGVRPARQFLGPGEESFSLSGTIIRELTGANVSLETLRDMGDQGEAWPLVSGSGEVFGAFNLDGVDERQAYFTADGTPRKIDFSINLMRVDDGDALAITSRGLDI
jgi:phage protein U